MTATTRCCSCGDAIEPGSLVWNGPHEDEVACSALCSYKSCVAVIDDRWPETREQEVQRACARVLLAREAILHDPDVFDQEGVLDVTVLDERSGILVGATSTTATIVLGATVDEVRLEVVAGEWEGSELNLRWDSILDTVLRDA